MRWISSILLTLLAVAAGGTALAAQAHLVGTVDYSDYPPAAKALPHPHQAVMVKAVASYRA